MFRESSARYVASSAAAGGAGGAGSGEELGTQATTPVATRFGLLISSFSTHSCFDIDRYSEKGTK